MNAARHVIIRQVDVELTGPEGPVPAEAELRYDPTDPYAVALAFPLADREVTWLFARDLLIRGVTEPVGDGDVRVMPSLDQDGRAAVAVLLRSPAGEAFVQLVARDVIRFVARTTKAVWPGNESEFISADAAIEAILVGH